MKKLYILTLISVFAVPFSAGVPYLTNILHLPIAFSGGDVWYFQYMAFFAIFLLGVSITVLWQFNKWISLFTILCLFSAIFTHDGTQFIYIQKPHSLMTLLQIYFMCVFSWGISLFNHRQRRNLLIAIVIAVILQGLWVVLQYFNIDPVFTGFGTFMRPGRIDDTVGFLGSHNQLGIYLASSSPAIVGMFPWALPLIIFGIWNSTTSFAFVSFVMAGLITAWVVNKRIFIIFIICAVVAGGIFFTKFDKFNGIKSPVLDERLALWKDSIDRVLEGRAEMIRYTTKIHGTPQETFRKYLDFMTVGESKKTVTCSSWLGYGLSNFIKISPYTQDRYLRQENGYHVYSHAHNDFIEVFFELGKAGVILLFMIIANLFWRFFFTIKTRYMTISFMCIVAQMLCALGVFTVHTAVNGMMLMIFLGIFEGEYKDATKAGKSSAMA